LIYGATGYTGRLIAERLVHSRCHTVIAGRTPHRVQTLSAALGIAGRTIAIEEAEALDQALDDVDVLINAASPFALTAPALIESCLRTKTHYLDITGELPVFQNAFLHDEAARGRGIMILPGAGFGVVASDCLAVHVAALVPNAKYLRIAVLRPGSFSRGTFRSALGVANSPVSIRRNGRLTLLPVGRLQRAFDFGDGERESVAVSWADVFTAYHSTGIRNIEAYFEAGLAARALYQLGAGVAGAMQIKPVKALIDAAAGVWPDGPSETRRQSEKCVIVAEAEDSWRQIRSARLETADGYSFTAQAAAAIAKRIVRGDFVSGFQTPARVYGADLALQFKGTHRKEQRRSFSAQERTIS
jgi:saccharopine dehydrogenase (NAD+, L-lysine-forming)